MASSNLVLHHGSILRNKSLACVLKPARLLLKFHSLSATWAITNNAVQVPSERLRSSNFCMHFRACSCKWKLLVRSCSTRDFVIAQDENYGNKQVVSLSLRLYDYVLKNVREPEVGNSPICPIDSYS